MQKNEEQSNQRERDGLPLSVLLVMIFVAIAIAAGLAYLVVNPFFHQPPK